MRRLLLFIVVAVWATSGLSLADTPKATLHPAKSKVAPADEYFGRLKMSVLGIANVIKDMRLRVQADAGKTPTIFGSLAMVEDAIRDWERKYPRDTWIAKDLLALEGAYLAASGDRAHLLAVKTEAWLHRDYPKTLYARQAHEALTKPVVTAHAEPAAVPAVPAVQPAIITAPVVPQAPAEGTGTKP